MREFAARGYAAVEQTTVSNTELSWAVAGQTIKVALTLPERGMGVPLVLYLPGLGEPSEAGERWRSAWAGAGYAVMSVQPLKEDATAWSSDLARQGDFVSLGRQHYAATVMAERLRLLDQVLAEARRRAVAGERPWQRVAWDRVAIAGFGLGAYTAMAVAGERVMATDQPLTSVNVRAAIALSPYVSFSQGSLNTRYRGIRLPTLSVTGDADRDELGQADGPFLRTAAFNHMPADDKYLLSLRGLPHAAFSGSAHTTGPRPERMEPSGPMSIESFDSGQRSVNRQRAGSGGQAGWLWREQPGSSPPLSAQGLELGRIAIQHVSIAFLDAYVQDDSLAREWLATDAQRWMGRSGELRRR
ncbi:alpha/beta hydrolase family protein [Sphaerotilaceae bacterium SBD11-9]